MQYRYSHVLLNMDLMTKKIFDLPQVTTEFIHVLDLPVEILEGEVAPIDRN